MSMSPHMAVVIGLHAVRMLPTTIAPQKDTRAVMSSGEKEVLRHGDWHACKHRGDKCRNREHTQGAADPHAHAKWETRAQGNLQPTLRKPPRAAELSRSLSECA